MSIKKVGVEMLETIKRKRLQKSDLLSYSSPYFSNVYWIENQVSAGNQVSDLSPPKIIKNVKESPKFFKPSKHTTIIKHNALGVDYNLIYCPIGTFNFSLTVHTNKGRLFPDNYVAEIEKPFLLGETEVTRELYYTVMGLTDDPKYKLADPQTAMNREALIQYLFFCNKLSALENLQACYTFELEDKMFWGEMRKEYTFHFDPSKNGYRLPSSKEWQYAAKAGTENKWSGTDDQKKLKDYAILSTSKNSLSAPQIVKQKKPNEWGFYDMTGNVQELVSNSSMMITRAHGGCFRAEDHSLALLSSTRIDMDQTDTLITGFRIARTLG